MEHDHSKECGGCDMGMAALQKWHIDCMEKDGFYMHYVPTEDGWLNSHTHGFEETWNHPDMQVVLPLSQETVSGILWNFARRVKAGEVFKAGDKVDRIIGSGYQVLLMESVETQRPILRILLPDENGRFPDEEGCTKGFAAQREIDTR